MTLELENAPLLSNIGLNSSYNNEPDFTALDRVTSKKTSVITVTRKESLLAREKFKEKREMSGRYSDDYDSYEDDFDDESPAKESTTRRSSRRESRMSERIRSASRSPSVSPPKYQSRSKKSSTRRDSLASYRSAYGTNRGKYPVEFFRRIVTSDVIFIDTRIERANKHNMNLLVVALRTIPLK